MAYVPINLQIFSAAYAGAMAAFGSSSYADGALPPFGTEAAVALVFAQAIDTQWNNAAVPTTFDVETTFDASLILMRDRGPFPATSPFTNVSNWIPSANQIVNSILIGEATANAAGIVFPPWFTGSGSPTGPAGGDLSGTYPNPAVFQAHLTDQPVPPVPPAGTLTLASFNQQGFSVAHVYDTQGNAIEITRDNLTVIRNNTGGVLTKGTVVYVNGATGTVPTVAKAKADSLTTLPAFGIIYNDVNNNAFGRVLLIGNLENINLSAFATGDTLYVSATTAGALTNVAPASPNLTQSVGTVLNNGVGNGVLQFRTSAAVNGVPLGSAAGGDLGGFYPNPTVIGLTGTAGAVNIHTGVTLRPTADSITAFQVSKAGAGANVFNIDTTNGRIGINNAAPASALDVTGTINASVQVILPLAGSIICQQIRDTNNNNWVESLSVVNAINNLRVGNASVGNPITLEPVGGDVNVGIKYRSRGTGTMFFRPGADTVTAFQITKADDATVILNADSTNRRIGINNAAPGFDLDVTGVGRFTTAVQAQTLRDTNGNAWLTATTTATAVNNINITDAATGNAPTFSAVGTDTNVGLNYLTKGTGIHLFRPGTDSVTAFQVSKAGGGANVFDIDTTNARVGINNAAPAQALDVTGTGNFTVSIISPITRTTTLQDANGNTWLDVSATAAAVNFVEITNKATGTGPNIAAVGGDTNIALNLFTKGTGAFIFTRNGGDATGAFQVRNSAGNRVFDIDTTNSRTACFGAGAVSTTPFSALSVEDSVSGASAVLCDMNNIKGGTTTNNVLELQGGNNTGVGSSDIISFLRPDGTQIGHVLQNAATTVQYATSSDRKLKKDIKPSVRGIDILNKVKVRDYRWKQTNKKEQGFIAQELINIYPEAVTRGRRTVSRGKGKSKRIVPWSVDYGRVTPLLVKAIQDLSGEVTRLQKEVKRLQKAGK